MPVEELVLQKLRTLSPGQQQEVLHSVEFLVHKRAPKTARQSVKGLWADLGLTITDEDIDAARREMWGRFPRELSE